MGGDVSRVRLLLIVAAMLMTAARVSVTASLAAWATDF
ncbi:MAG: hypothetical protein E5Y06_26280 [Mesorhizobium sp.]|nr:MAG: hypothetical protein E5Y06_26280 [Mesorhizobium sp.]TIW89976.1 MAG: hypothetical protein E5V51_03045 [Mesorhizobium sp.]TJU94787.1 MAG: hypothetical protein E5Y08_28525 [Mesorhizobium sp.]